jgi:hypothetical protein
MNDHQMIAMICRKCELPFTLGDLEHLVVLCQQFAVARKAKAAATLQPASIR